MDLPEMEPRSGQESERMMGENQNVEDIANKIDDLRKKVEELQELSHIGSEADKKVKKLQAVVARIWDDLKRQKHATKSIIRELNIINCNVMELASRHDFGRVERIWDGSQGAGSSSSRSDTPSRSSMRRWSSESDIAGMPFPVLLRLPLHQPSPRASAFPPAVASSPTFDYLRTLEGILKIHGRVRRPEMDTLLRMWRAKAGSGASNEVLLKKAFKFLRELLGSRGHSTGFPEEVEELVAKARKFLDRPWQELMTLAMTQTYDAVMEGIPEEEWLTFARDELGIPESDITEVKRHCTPTREQLHQVDLASDAWKEAHDMNE